MKFDKPPTCGVSQDQGPLWGVFSHGQSLWVFRDDVPALNNLNVFGHVKDGGPLTYLRTTL